MALPPIVRRAIFDRQGSHRPPGMKSGSATTSVVVRLVIDPARVRDVGGRERQINLKAREISCLSPFQMTLFSSKEFRRRARLIVNRRRAYLLSISNTGILVFTYHKLPN